MRRDVVIVTPDYLASTPRVVKEADALAEAGLEVGVVFSEGPIRRHRAADEGIARGRPWSAHPIRWSPDGGPREALRWLVSGARSSAARAAARRLGTFPLAALASCRLAPELALRAASLPARLYLGHYPGGLVAAAAAATIRGALLGYDAEDLHTGEPESNRGAGHRARVRSIEGRLLARCASVSASSRPIAEALAREYGIQPPRVVHNAFAWRDRSSLDGRRLDRSSARPSATWFSQTIGLDRGLQDAIAGLAATRQTWELHLRGSCAPDVRARLQGLARSAGVEDRVHLHAPVAPGELLSRVAEHDVGLALEQPGRVDYDLACTNKVFTYLLAGLPIVATRTQGQVALLEQLGGAAHLVPAGSPGAIAAALDRLAPGLDAAKAAALDAARTRWCWEVEARPHVESLLQLLGRAR